MNDKTAVSLTRMLSAQNNNYRLIGFLLILIRDLQKRQIYTAVRFPDRRKLDELERTRFGDFTDLSEMGLHLGISVWNCVGDEHFITSMLKLVIKTHNVV